MTVDISTKTGSDSTNPRNKTSDSLSLESSEGKHAGSPQPAPSQDPTNPSDRVPRWDDSVGFSTKSVHAGEARQKPCGSISAPIVTASTFTFESTEALLRFVEGHEDRPEYGRYGTPNEKSVEAKLGRPRRSGRRDLV